MKTHVGLNYNKIYIIQSLPEGERSTGEDLYYDNIYYKIIQSEILKGEFWKVSNTSEFIARLKLIAYNAKNNGEYPIIHLELHGDKNGFLVADGGYIPWAEVSNYFQEINVYSMHNLLIVLAVCEGVYLSRIIRAEDRAPFWGIIGPEGVIKSREITEHYPRFYDLFLRGQNADEAIRYLNSIVLDSKTSFRLMNSEWLFMSAFNDFCDKLASKDAVDQRVKEIIGKYDKFKLMTREQKREEAKRMRKEIPRIMQSKYYEYKRIFFMEDLFPENKELYSVSYEEMKRNYRERDPKN